VNILFIGGTGNISTDCAALLHERGHSVAMLTRGTRPVPEQYRAIVADHADIDAVRSAVGNDEFDAVVNFIGYEVADIEIDADVFRGRTGQYVQISTTAVYAKPHDVLPLNEASSVGNQFSEYGQKKLACERFLWERCHGLDFPVTIVRPSHTYSCRWVPNPVSSTTYTLAARMEAGKPVFVHGTGQSLWTLTHTTDFAVGLAGLIGNKQAIGEVVVITSDEVLTWNQICLETARAAGVKSPEIVQVPIEVICEAAPIMLAKLKGDKAEHGVFDNAKIKRLVPEFQCRTSFREGIAQSIDWFRRHPDLMVADPQVDAVFEAVLAAWREQ
jgi:nucleoside-diphosphate-sugar epimerase